MQINALHTPPAEAFAYARLSDTLDNRPITRTLRYHAGARELGEFSAFLTAKRRVAANQFDRVEPRSVSGLSLSEWLAVAVVGTIMWTAVFAGLAA